MNIIRKLSKHPIFSILLALVVCALWGSLFPFIKLGYDAFGISGTDVPALLLFAGIRFIISGVVMLIIFSLGDKKLLLPTRRSLTPVLGVALFTIVLHYTFTYWALTLGESSKSAIIKQIGYLFLSCFSFVFIKSDRFALKKLIAGILGFIGIIVTNYSGDTVTLGLGDALLIAASFCSVSGTVITKKAVEHTSPLLVVCYSQLIGGAVLLSLGLGLGGRFGRFDLTSALVLGYMCFASIIAYTLWNVLIKDNTVSKLAVIKFSEPLFAVILSGIILGEDVLRLNYLIALLVILAAILLNNSEDVKKK